MKNVEFSSAEVRPCAHTSHALSIVRSLVRATRIGPARKQRLDMYCSVLGQSSYGPAQGKPLTWIVIVLFETATLGTEIRGNASRWHGAQPVIFLVLGDGSG